MKWSEHKATWRLMKIEDWMRCAPIFYEAACCYNYGPWTGPWTMRGFDASVFAWEHQAAAWPEHNVRERREHEDAK